MRKKLFKISVLIILILFAFAATKKPSNDRNWRDYYTNTPDAIIEEETVTLKNVRNWNHSNEEILSEEWLDEVVIDKNSIKQVWFGFSGFSKNPALGHTLLSFELDNGSVYTLSVEARQEIGEKYSAIKGLFNEFELLYGWATERDYVGVRVFLLNQPVELYPLNLNREEAQAVFMAMAQKTHNVATEPKFYNTITSNCTNELAATIKEKWPDRISYNIAQNLPGLSVNYLDKIGLIEVSKRKVIPKNNPQLQETIHQTPADFSLVLRQLLTD